MITIVGSINLDLFATADRLPAPGETVLGNGFSTAPGGKGANQALACLRAGADMRLVGCVGDDGFASEALAILRRDGADLSGVRAVPGPTGVALIVVAGAGENSIVVVPGANAAVGADQAAEAVTTAPRGGLLLLQQEIPVPAIRAALQAARGRGLTSMLNIAPILPETAELAALADIVVANETEFAALLRAPAEGDVAGAARGWARRTGRTLVLTLGEDGAIAATPEGLRSAPSPKIDPVDTVGAGDTFCGYLAAGLDAGMPLEAALARATVAGALACLKPGAQPAIPTAAEVEAAMRG